MTRFRNCLTLALLCIACSVGLAVIHVLLTLATVIRQVPAEVAALRRDVDQQVTLLRTAADAQATATREALVLQIAAARADVTHQILPVLDARLAAIQRDADQQLGQANETLRRSGETLGLSAEKITASAETLTGRYTRLPDELALTLRPSWVALEPEFTCRRPDGSGYGGCAHSRVNALLGEAARAGGAFARDFPLLSGSITGIASDAHTFTSRAVAPCRGWCLVRSMLTTSSGVVRAAGAAGVF